MTIGPVVLVGAAAALDGCGGTPTYGSPDTGVHDDANWSYDGGVNR